MNSPSKMILEGILAIMQEKQLSTTALAQKINLDKKNLKRILAGETPLTVDTLSLLGSALEINDGDVQRFLNVPSQPEIEESITPNPTDTPVLQFVGNEMQENELADWTPNPVGNHSEQALKMGFALGCNILFVAKSEFLADSGVPKNVLEKFGAKLPIHLDSAYFQHYKPDYYDDGLEIRLSFDAVYTCFFPWHSFEQITFFVDDDPVVTEPEPTTKGGLRLV